MESPTLQAPSVGAEIITVFCPQSSKVKAIRSKAFTLQRKLAHAERCDIKNSFIRSV